MSEAAMWKSLRPLLRGLDPIRVENHMVPGTPDVNYTQGWIELKYAPAWPVRGGPLAIDHFTPEQRSWLFSRYQAGGRVFLLLKVGAKEWLLFKGEVAAIYVGKSNQQELYQACVARWTRRPELEEIQRWLV